jgi:putative hydrolase of the HAD superfamily
LVDDGNFLQKCDAAVFDLDDTLIGTLYAYTASMPALLASLDLPNTTEHVEQAFAMLTRLRTYRLEDLFFALLRNAGVTPHLAREKALEQAEPANETILAHMHVLPGSSELLTELHSRGIKLALVTNGFPAWQRRKLVHSGLDRFFPDDLQIVSGDLPRFSEKPSLGIFWECASRLGMDPERMVFIGDRTTDILGANIAGMVSVLVATGRPTHAEATCKLECPNLKVADLTELRRIWIESYLP